MNSKGVELDPPKVKAIKEWKILTTVEEIGNSLCLVGYYRWPIKDFAKMATLLTDLTHTNVPYH